VVGGKVGGFVEVGGGGTGVAGSFGGAVGVSLFMTERVDSDDWVRRA